MVMYRSGDGADFLTGSIFTLDTGKRLELYIRILQRTVHIGIDPDPVHFTLAGNLFLSNDWNVILRLARDDTGIAAGAGIKIN